MISLKLSLSLLAALAPQDDLQRPPTVDFVAEAAGTVVSLNPTTHSRYGVTTTVLPFAKGVHHGEPLAVMTADGRPGESIQQEVFGAP